MFRVAFLFYFLFILLIHFLFLLEIVMCCAVALMQNPSSGLRINQDKKVKTYFNFFEFYDCSAFDARPLHSLAYSDASQTWIAKEIQIGRFWIRVIWCTYVKSKGGFDLLKLFIVISFQILRVLFGRPF